MKAEANAKVNFTLDVFGRRPDGYHALRSVVMPISLADTLEVEATDDARISSDTGYEDDLCIKAARVLLSARALASDSRCGARIRVTKRIPVGGGLGGGSADAAAVLRALNGLWGLNLPLAELARIGALVGSDVPALVFGRPVLMEGRGEKVVPLTVAARYHLVLVNPGVHSSTREVYGACEARGARAPAATDAMMSALERDDFPAIVAALSNDLQTAAIALHPEIADALTALRAAGAKGVMMTGSGSCVFGLVPDVATAEDISAALTAKGLQSWPIRTC